MYESNQKNSIDKQEKVIGICNSIDESQISQVILWFLIKLDNKIIQIKTI